MQYTNDTSTVKFGVRASARNDVTRAVNLEIPTVTGRNIWKWDVSPVLTYNHSVDGSNFSLQYSGGPQQVPSRMMIPVPDITDPVRVTTGNIHLKSGFSNSLMAYYNLMNYATYTFFTAYVHGNVDRNGIVDASWFDKDGVRYAIPVNSRKPNMSVTAYALLNQPFGRQKNFTFSLTGQFGMNMSHSYQADARMPGIDLVNFDYRSFMGDFWGDEDGDRLSYMFHRSFSDGFGTPELRWDMNFAKTVKSVTFGLKLADILNRTNDLTRTVSAEYVEDRYSNVMGRRLLFSLSFNFGKTNKNKTSAVSKAMKQLEY